LRDANILHTCTTNPEKCCLTTTALPGSPVPHVQVVTPEKCRDTAAEKERERMRLKTFG
jgi:hypothetical protein